VFLHFFVVIMPEPRFDYERPQAGKAKANQEAAVFFARAARSTVKNGWRTTLIARKLAATTSVFVSHWEWGQILLIPGVLGLAVMSIVGLLFPKANTPGRGPLPVPAPLG
jgi:hypothetical protein